MEITPGYNIFLVCGINSTWFVPGDKYFKTANENVLQIREKTDFKTIIIAEMHFRLSLTMIRYGSVFCFFILPLWKVFSNECFFGESDERFGSYHCGPHAKKHQRKRRRGEVKGSFYWRGSLSWNYIKGKITQLHWDRKVNKIEENLFKVSFNLIKKKMLKRKKMVKEVITRQKETRMGKTRKFNTDKVRWTRHKCIISVKTFFF